MDTARIHDLIDAIQSVHYNESIHAVTSGVVQNDAISGIIRTTEGASNSAEGGAIRCLWEVIG